LDLRFRRASRHVCPRYLMGVKGIVAVAKSTPRGWDGADVGCKKVMLSWVSDKQVA
jgi:hypothetical protein